MCELVSQNAHKHLFRNVFINIRLCLIGVCIEGAAVSGESFFNDKSQSITAASASNTRQHTHASLLL